MRAGSWIGFAVLSAVILVYSTDFVTGQSAYLALVESLSGKPVDVEDNLTNFGHTVFRKSNHVLAFFLLGLSTIPFRRVARDARRLAVACCASVALASEMVQVLSVFRHPAVYDVAVNLAAALLGLWLVFQPPHFLRTVSRDNFPLVRIWARPTR